MPLSVTQAQLNTLSYYLECLYTRSSTYAARLASKDMHEAELRVLLDQHRTQAVRSTLCEIETLLGGWDVRRDPTEGACP